MLIDFIENGKVLHARFKNDIHFETSHLLQEELSKFQLSNEFTKVVIDFSKVRFVDSSGIGLLLKWIHPMSNLVSVELIHVSEPVQNIFRICKLDEFADIVS